MAEVEIAPLADRLAEDEIRTLESALKEVGAPHLQLGDESGSKTIADGVDEDLASELLDRLDAFDAACEVYLPLEFDAVVKVGDVRYGSLQSLIDALEEMKDDLDIEAEEETEDPAEDDDTDYDYIRAQLKQLWKVLYIGAQTSMDRKLALYVRI